MSDLCVYEIVDIVWDEFCRSDDHTVPVSDFERIDGHSILGDSHKKPRHEIASVSDNSGERFATQYFDQEREHREFSVATERINGMLEKDSWSHSSIDVFPSPNNLIKGASCLDSNIGPSASQVFTSNNTDNKVSECGANDTLLVEKASGYISHTTNDFDFFENTEDKGSSDFLYCGWPEIGNFEDVDRMFRSCDETFGVGASKEDDEMGWFASADNTEGSGLVVRSDFKFPYPEANPTEKVAENNFSSKNYSDDSTVAAAASIYCNGWTSEKSGPAIADKRDGFIHKEKSNENKREFKQWDQSLRKRKDKGNFRNGCLSHTDNQASEFIGLPSDSTSDQAVQKKQASSSDSSNYLQDPVSYMHSGNSHLSGLTSVKSETNDFTSSSPRDSSQASNQVQTVGSFHECRLQLPVAGICNGEKLNNHHGNRSSATRSLKNCSAITQTAVDNGKQVDLPEDKLDHRDAEGASVVIQGELSSSNVIESSTMSSSMDNISLEAASFCQLQLVMEKLDLKTKLCIRDSLYRLARSAEQRHNQSNFHGGERGDGIGAFVDERTNDFMDTETDTNPIDRSIAHLLFHRPSESLSVPANNTLSSKAPLMVSGSVLPAPVMVQKLVDSGTEKVSES